MAAVLVTASELARELGVSPTAVAKARDSGRLTAIDGKYDLAVAKIQWEANRRRRRMDQVAPPRAERPEEKAEEAADFWISKARREAAEAEISELKAAELRGDLVRRAAVERQVAGRLVALRESLEVLADRLSAVLAAETDQQAVRRILRDEHRAALSAFNELRLAQEEDAEDGIA